MHEPEATQATLEDHPNGDFHAGQVDEARKLVLHLAQLRFGEADAGSRQCLEMQTCLVELERLAERLLDASCWEDLLTDSFGGQDPLD